MSSGWVAVARPKITYGAPTEKGWKKWFHMISLLDMGHMAKPWEISDVQKTRLAKVSTLCDQFAGLWLCIQGQPGMKPQETGEQTSCGMW